MFLFSYSSLNESFIEFSCRYDILLDLVRVVSDVTVADIVNIWVYCLKSTTNKLVSKKLILQVQK